MQDLLTLMGIQKRCPLILLLLFLTPDVATASSETERDVCYVQTFHQCISTLFALNYPTAVSGVEASSNLHNLGCGTAVSLLVNPAFCIDGCLVLATL